MENVQNLAQKVIRVLKLSDISIPYGKTNKGELYYKVIKDETEGFFTLDSVPINKEENKELKKLFEIE